MNLRYVSVLALLSLATPAWAEEVAESPATDGLRDSAITVLATGSAAPLWQAGQSVSVVDNAEITSIQGPDVARVLERLPGLAISRNGGLGTTTSVFVRGASSEQVLVLVDGARVTDVAAPGGGYDFANLSATGIAKLELLRGSNSVIWGSEAIGGVLAVTSRQPEGIEATAEYGANKTFDGQLAAGLSGERYALALSGGYTRSDGVSAAAVGTEDDGFRQWRVGGRGRFDLGGGLSASAVARYADSRTDIDGYPAPNYTFADTPEYQKTREGSGRAGLDYTSDALDLGASFALSETRRAYFDPTFGNAPNFTTKGRRERADLTGQWRATDAVRVDFGAAREWVRFAADGNQKAHTTSAHAVIGWYGERLSLAAGARIDDHSRFGSEWTIGANGSYVVADGWRLRASYGEGFKAPTLYQLFSEYGNTALSPERSRSYDIGIEKGDRDAPLHFALTAFRRDSRNLIDYVSCFSVSNALCADGRFGFYGNVARARAQGVELELGAKVSERFRAQAVYSYLKARNRTAGDVNEGNDLARRPHHTVTVSADWTTPLADLELGGDIRLVGNRFDNAANTTRLDGYALVTLRASLPVSKGLELYGRVENLTDGDYRTIAGYGTPGRAAYLGARARF